MCGICGICMSNCEERPDEAVLESMTTRLAHRGPDAGATYVSGSVGLGHRRLSIIDLQGGHQPMFTEDRSAVIVFNGEIYNYVELREVLKQEGYVFRSESDTEVILHLYRRDGNRCVDKLNGMFAFVIWDERSQTVFAARDRMGEKPFYYFMDGGNFIFASELKALVRHPAVAARVSLRAIDDYLAYGYVPDDRCIIEGVAKLPPGCALTWRAGRVSVTQYWDVRFGEEVVCDEVVWIEELERRLRESIRIRLRSDVPLGVFLSGGVDSSAVVALACQEVPRLRTFSIGFDVAGWDELDHARRVAELYGTNHTEFVVSDHDVSVLPSLVYQLDEPFADPSALPMHYVCREARREVVVCLSGDGADELLAGYSRYRQALRYQKVDGLARFGVKKLCRVAARFVPPGRPGRGFMDRMALDGAERYFSQCAKFCAEERCEMFRPEFVSEIEMRPWLFSPYFGNGRNLLEAMQHCDQKTYLPDDILVKVDRMAMGNSLEVRVPFLDHTLVEFMNNSPHGMKLRNGLQKYGMKQMLRKRLPEQTLSRSKMGFGIPLGHWLRGGQRSFVRDILLSRETRCTQWLRPDAIERIVERNEKNGRLAVGRKVWTLLMLELWCRAFHC